MVVISVCSPTNSTRGFPFLHTLSSIYCLWIFDDGHSDWCEVISHCSLICIKKGTTEDEMDGWHHWLDGRESEWTLGVGDGGRHGVLRFVGSQRVTHDWATGLNWTEQAQLLWGVWALSSSLHWQADSLPLSHQESPGKDIARFNSYMTDRSLITAFWWIHMKKISQMIIYDCYLKRLSLILCHSMKTLY